MSRKIARKGIEMRKNPTTGYIEARDPNLDLNWKIAKFIGHNFNGGDEWHEFDTPYANISAYDAPDYMDFLFSLIGNKPNTNIVTNEQAIKANDLRAYAMNQASALSITEDQAKNNAEAEALDFTSNALFVPNLYSQNIICSGIPNISFSGVPSGKDFAYYPLIIDETKNRISNKGRLVGLITKMPLSGLTTTEFNNISINLTSNIASVGGNTSTNTFSIGTSSTLKILRTRSLVSIKVSESGNGYTSTNLNKGLVTFNANLQNWYWTGTTSSDARVVPIVIGRIAQYNNLVATGTNTKPDFNGDTSNSYFDFYFNDSRTNLNQDSAGIMDCWILDGGENMPNEAYEKYSYTFTADSNNWYDRIYRSQAYIYDSAGFNLETREVANMPVKEQSYEQLRQLFITAKKRGVFLSINLWDGRHPYNSGGFAKSKRDKEKEYGYYLAEWETQMNKVLTYVDELCIEFNTYCKVLMANESTLDYTMSGKDYSNDDAPNPTYDQNIYWWDPANPTNKMANLRKQLEYYNAIVKRYKNNTSRSQRILFSYVAQYGSDTQATEIETLITEGKLDNFDFLSNNYYGSYSTTEPQRNGSGQYVLDRYIAFYNSQTDIKKKLPMLLSECGIPAKIFLVPKTLNVGTQILNVVYNNVEGNNTPTFWFNGVDVTSQIIVVDNLNARAELIKNLIIWVKDKPAIMGVQHFGMTLQNGRSQKLQYMEWDSFNCPFPTNVAGGITPSTHDVFFDEYWMGDLNYPIRDTNEFTSIHDIPSNTTETQAIYTSCLTKMKEAIETYTGNDALIYNI